MFLYEGSLKRNSAIHDRRMTKLLGSPVQRTLHTMSQL